MLFQFPQEGSPDLVFGRSAEPAVPHYEATLTLTLPELTFSATLIPDVRATLAVTLPALTFIAEANYASNTARPEVGQTRALHQVAQAAENGVADGFKKSARSPVGIAHGWQAATPIRPAHRARHADSQRLATSRHLRHQEGMDQVATQRSRWQDGTRIKQSRRSGFQAAQACRQSRNARHQDGIRTKAAKTSHYQPAALMQRDQHAAFQKAMPWLLGGNGRYQDAMRPPAGIHTTIQPPIQPPKEWTADLLFAKPYSGSAALIFGWVGNPGGSTIIIPVRSVYIMINEISLHRVSNGLYLPPVSFSLSIDRGSWTWGFNASFPLTALADLEPNVAGDPVELEAEINGNPYRVLVESITRERSFGSGSISVGGRGKSAWLDSPYAPVLNFGNTQERTAQQLMQDALMINGVSIGWDIDWRITDWAVPAGVWSHQGAYISALKTIAGAAGAYLQPHPTQQIIRVMPAYPTAPWEWDSLTPEIELPSAVTTREGIEWIEKTRYNAVYVSGQSAGVLGHVKRTGTAGDVMAPMIVDPLITHADAARQRGLSILGDAGRIANVSLRVPVLPETGVIEPGAFIRYVDGGTARRGLVRSTAIDVAYPEVFQTLGVETHA